MERKSLQVNDLDSKSNGSFGYIVRFNCVPTNTGIGVIETWRFRKPATKEHYLHSRLCKTSNSSVKYTSLQQKRVGESQESSAKDTVANYITMNMIGTLIGNLIPVGPFSVRHIKGTS